MASAKTQGFSLSTLPRASNIPANAGAVDVKEIYDGVRQGLAAFENVRRTPASMLLADAEMKAKTAEAPLGTRQVLAQTEGIEQQTPLKTAILASEASPEMQEAKRQALLARNVRAASGDIQLATSLAAARQRLAEDPLDGAAAQLVAVLEPMALKKSAVSAANPQGAIDAGVQKTADTNATRVATNDASIAGRASEGAADREARAAIATADREARERISSGQLAHKTALATAKTDQQRALVGSKAKTALVIGQQRNKDFNETVDLAVANLTGNAETPATESSIPGGNILSAVSRMIGSFIPGSKSTDLEALIATLKSEAGFAELEKMRVSSPGNTGASGLGQITEKELAFLQNRIADIRLSQSDKQLYDNIKRFQDAVNNAWKNAAAAYEFDYGPKAAPTVGVGPGGTAQTAAVPRAFATAADAEAAGARGEIKTDEVISVGGKPFKWAP